MTDSRQETEAPEMTTPEGQAIRGRYSLKQMMQEVAVERRESVFARELVDSSEIEKMFSKQKLKKRR